MENFLAVFAIVAPIIAGIGGNWYGAHNERKKAQVEARRQALQPIDSWLDDVMGFDAGVGRTLSNVANGLHFDEKVNETQAALMDRLHTTEPKLRGILASSVFRTRSTRKIAEDLNTLLLDLIKHLTQFYLPTLARLSSEWSQGITETETAQSFMGAARHLNGQVQKAYALITDLQTKLA